MAYIFYIFVYVPFFVVAAVMLKRRRPQIKWSLILLGFVVWCLVPTWDLIRNYYVFKSYCEKDAGLHLYGKINKEEGILIDHIIQVSAEDYLNRYGFSFVEGIEQIKDVAKWEELKLKYPYKVTKKYFRNGDGDIVGDIVDKSSSRYIYDRRLKRDQVSDRYKINSKISSVYDNYEKKYIFEFIGYEWRGGWAINPKTLGSPTLSGHMAECPNKIEFRRDYLKESIK